MNDKRVEAGWRIRIGFALLVASMAWPATVPLLGILGVSGTSIAVYSGVMLIVAEIMMVTGAAVAGRDGFAYIKQRVFGLAKRLGPAREVSRTRYAVGLAMFTAPLLLAWTWPYLGRYLPGALQNPLAYAVAGDVLLLASLFVLGGAFWDKLRSLFMHRARAVIP